MVLLMLIKLQAYDLLSLESWQAGWK